MAHTSDNYRLHTAMKWNEIGQNLYRQSKYEDALQAFNAAIKAEHEDVALVLDNRAATYERLGRHDHALKDARRMIQYEKKQARGYLRTGKILLEMDKPELALQIYERGLKYCTKEEPNYNALHKQTVRLASQYMERFDFLETLPIELIHEIFSYVSFATLCKCTMVCNRWRRFLTSQPYLWNRIELSFTRPVRRMALFSYIQRAKGILKSIHIGGVDLQGTKSLYHVFKSSPLLEEMVILSGGLLAGWQFKGLDLCRHMKSLRLGQRVDVDVSTVAQILALNQDLELISIEHVSRGVFPLIEREKKIWAMDLPNLKIFNIICVGWNGGSPHLAQILPNAPNLNTFSFQMHPGYIYWTPDSRSAFLDYKSLKAIHLGTLICANGHEHDPHMLRGLPSTLQILELRPAPCTFPSLLLDENCQLPELRVLRIPHNNMIFEFLPILEATEDGLSALEELETICPEDFVGVHSSRYPRMRKLRCIKYHGAFSFNDQCAAEVVEIWKDLEKITLDQATITGIAVRAFVENLPKLKCLVFEKCTKIGSDAIEWARAQGIDVKIDLGQVH